jgi:hypothetical protein
MLRIGTNKNEIFTAKKSRIVQKANRLLVCYLKSKIKFEGETSKRVTFLI